MEEENLPHPRNNVLMKSWSEQTLSIQAKYASVNPAYQPDMMMPQAAPGKHAGKQQSRNTNLVNIADNLDDQLMIMPTLHRRSFSESHLDAAGSEIINHDLRADGEGDGAYNTGLPQNNLFEIDDSVKFQVTNFNTAGTKGAKASRNVLYDANKKADDQAQPSPQGKFINLLGGGRVAAQPKTSDLDRLVAVHTRNAKGGRQKQTKQSSPTQQHKNVKKVKLDPFEESRSEG